jgi:hypothetical protein
MMNKLNYMAMIAALAVSSELMALPFSGTEITIYDGDGYSGSGIAGEDGETEPGMVNNQGWDLEGFWLQDNGNLAIVGGFNFMTGVTGFNGVNGTKDFTAGDIFIDVDGDYIAGNAYGGSDGQPVVNDTFGYEYVIDIDWNNGSYEVRELTENSYTQEGWYKQNYGSSPWVYVGEDELGEGLAKPISDGEFKYSTTNDADYGSVYYNGAFHNAAYDFDISAITEKYDDLVFHNTMGCGNDHLLGQVSEVPEPSSIVLLGLGILGLGVLRRKKA